MSEVTLNGKDRVGSSDLLVAGETTRAGVIVDEYLLSVWDLLDILWGRAALIVTAVAATVALVVGFGLLQELTYEASAKVLVGERGGVAAELTEVEGLQKLTQTMAEAMQSRTVVEPVIAKHGLRVSPEDFLEERLSVQTVGDTQFIHVVYEDTDPERARSVVNDVAEGFSRQIAAAGSGGVSATVWERAGTPHEPANPTPARRALLGSMLGLIMGVSLAFLLEWSQKYRGAARGAPQTNAPKPAQGRRRLDVRYEESQ